MGVLAVKSYETAEGIDVSGATIARPTSCTVDIPAVFTRPETFRFNARDLTAYPVASDDAQLSITIAQRQLQAIVGVEPSRAFVGQPLELLL